MDDLWIDFFFLKGFKGSHIRANLRSFQYTRFHLLKSSCLLQKASSHNHIIWIEWLKNGDSVKKCQDLFYNWETKTIFFYELMRHFTMVWLKTLKCTGFPVVHCSFSLRHNVHLRMHSIKPININHTGGPKGWTSALLFTYRLHIYLFTYYFLFVYYI